MPGLNQLSRQVIIHSQGNMALPGLSADLHLPIVGIIQNIRSFVHGNMGGKIIIEGIPYFLFLHEKGKLRIGSHLFSPLGQLISHFANIVGKSDIHIGRNGRFLPPGSKASEIHISYIEMIRHLAKKHVLGRHGKEIGLPKIQNSFLQGCAVFYLHRLVLSFFTWLRWLW